MLDDLKAAYRALKSSKTFTAVALTVLALGIGASTAIFSVVDAVVLRGLPFDEHDRLVAVGERSTGGRSGGPSLDPQAVGAFAPQNYIDLSAQQQVFESVSAITSAAVTLREPGAEPEEMRAQRVTGVVLHRAAAATGPRPRLHGGKRKRRPASGGSALRRPLAPAIRRRPRHRRQDHPARGRRLYGARRDGSRVRISHRLATPDRTVRAVRRAAGRADPRSASRQHLPPEHRAAQARRLAGAGAGEHGSNREGAPAGEPGLEQGHALRRTSAP